MKQIADICKHVNIPKLDLDETLFFILLLHFCIRQIMKYNKVLLPLLFTLFRYGYFAIRFGCAVHIELVSFS